MDTQEQLDLLDLQDQLVTRVKQEQQGQQVLKGKQEQLDLLDPKDLQEQMEKGLPVEFGHSLTDLLGGQCDAGLVITDIYEDYMLDSPLHKFHPSYIATREVKK